MRCQSGENLSRHSIGVQSLVSLGLSLAMASSQHISTGNLRHARSRKALLMPSSDPSLSLAGTTMTLSGDGYDTAQGRQALCWRGRAARYEATASEATNFPSSPLEDFHLLGRTELLGDCSSQTLQVGSPQAQRGERLRTGETYDFDVQVDIDLSLLLEPDSSEKYILWVSDAEDVSAQLKLILCDTHTSGFCTPFVHEESVLTGSPQPSLGALHGSTHLDSSTTLLTTGNSSQALSLASNTTIPMKVQVPGDYFVIAALELYTQEISENGAFLRLYHRWDIANAIADGGRVSNFQEPPTLLEVSPKVELISYIAIAVAASVVAGLLISTIYYRNSQILKLTQGWFLILYLTCALTAVVSSFLLNPKSDVYCRLSYPIVLTSTQLMYALCCGRLWRLHAVLSPIFQHRDIDLSGKDDTTHKSSAGDIFQAHANSSGRLQRRCRKLLQSCLQYFPILRKYQATNCSSAGGLKRTVPYWHLNAIVFACTLPQLLLQIASVTRQPQQRVIKWNEDESIGRAQCEYVHEPGEEPAVSLLFVSFLMLVVFLLVLLAVAFYCRNLPSAGILNESRQIYDTAMTSMILLMLGTGIIRLTDNATSSPDVEYTVWVTVILWTTVNSAMRLMHRKLRMAYQGKTVVVSALVQEHNRKQRQKQDIRLKELADRANAFQKSVLPLVKDQTLHAVVMQSCFVGEEAIDALVHDGIVASRWEGLQLGRDLVNDLGLFHPIGGNVQQGAGFQDDFVLYRFRAFDEQCGTLLPESQCMRQMMMNRSHRNLALVVETEVDDIVNRYSRDELEGLAEGFTAYVDVRDRKYHLRTYHNCFIGSEAVDSMIYAGLAHTREEAVKLGKRLQRELNLFHHVCDDWSFEDKRLFFRMRQKVDLKPTEDGLDEHETDDLPTLARRKSWLSVTTASMNSSIGSSLGNSWKMPPATVNTTVKSTRNLTKDAKRFIDLVSVKDRKYHMRTYKRVFVGAEAVDSLVYSGMAATRWDAVQIGRTLARELRLFEHVTREHNFNDDWLFYRYTNANVPRELFWDDSGSVDFSEAESSDGLERSQLAETADLFKRCIDVRDRKYRGIRYKSCFVGSDAVDSIVFSGLVSSRPEAVKLGRYLARELRLFKCVTGSHVFSDEPLLYSFRCGADTMSVSSGGSGSNGTGSHDDTASTGRHAKLLETAEAFRKCADVRDRRYRLRTFKQCFVAVDTVDMMLTNGLAETRQDCVQLARKLARELGLFRHVCDDHDFCDAYLFFEFTGQHWLGVNAGKDGETRYKLDRLADCESWNAMGRLEPVPEAEHQSAFPRSISQIASDFELSDENDETGPFDEEIGPVCPDS